MSRKPSRAARRYADEIADHTCDTVSRAELRDLLAEAFDAGQRVTLHTVDDITARRDPRKSTP